MRVSSKQNDSMSCVTPASPYVGPQHVPQAGFVWSSSHGRRDPGCQDGSRASPSPELQLPHLSEDLSLKGNFSLFLFSSNSKEFIYHNLLDCSKQQLMLFGNELSVFTFFSAKSWRKQAVLEIAHSC